MFLFAEGPALANHLPPDDITPQSPDANQAPFWEDYLASERGITDASCAKLDQAGDLAFVMPAAPVGQTWVLLVVKQGTFNYVYYDPAGGHPYPSTGAQAPGYSHLIVCSHQATTTTTQGSTTTTQGSTTTTQGSTTTTSPQDTGEIIVEKIVLGEGSKTLEFAFNTTGFSLGDNTLAHGQSSSSGPVAVGSGYSVSETIPDGWTQSGSSCDDGSNPDNIDVSANEVVTCTFVNELDPPLVGASIVVTVGGTCVVDGDAGSGLISVTVSVSNGATVVLSDSEGATVETFTSDGSVDVPEGEVYNWAATPNEGFEFPAGSETSGTVTIETCSTLDVLPFTGGPIGTLGVIAAILLSTGLVLLTSSRVRRSGRAT